MSKRTFAILALLGLVAVALGALYASRRMCLPVWMQHRVTVPRCPDGELRMGLDLSAQNMRRGELGQVSVAARAYYTEGISDEVRTFSLREPRVTKLALIVGDKETALPPEGEDGWSDDGSSVWAKVRLPKDVPDGEHKIVATVTTALGEQTIETPLRLFAPARVHVLTDRPLYEPGHTIRFRAVVLRARDLVPLAQRPGTWTVLDPNGETVLEELAPAGDYGVVAGDFPLDPGAPEGTWTVRWSSSDASGQATVRVEPFTLPRFTVEATPSRGFYQDGDEPRLDGRVVYSSGAPVDATVTIEWSPVGAWPAPPAWFSDGRGALPKRIETDAEGRFTLRLPAVPSDVRGRFSLVARLTAIDPAGDQANGSASVLLVEDAIDVSTVTEMGGTLVEGMNNRLYLRATTPDGTVLSGATLRVQRAWDPTDKGTETKTDEDGVAQLQVDPGPPVNIVVPPMPVRPPRRPDAVERTGARELISDRDPNLRELVAMDAWNASLAACARFVDSGSAEAALSLRVAGTGQIIGVGQDGALEDCVARVVREEGMTYGDERIFRVSWRFHSDMASLAADSGGTADLPDVIDDELDRQLLDARACVEDDATEGGLPRMWLWSVQGGRFSARPVPDPEAESGAQVPSDVARCIEGRLFVLDEGKKLKKDQVPEEDQFGWVRVSASPAPRVQAQRPQAETFLGYELKVEAVTDDEEVIGDTKIRLRPGAVPALRLRAAPVLPEAGAKVVVTALRGPSFQGDLPKKLNLTHEGTSIEADLDEKKKEASFQLPKDAEGWWEVSYAGALARVYVRRVAELSVRVASAEKTYKPRQQAKILVDTIGTGGKAGPASVTLVGVDETLGQLAPLPSPGAMEGLRVAASGTSAFGVLEAAALEQGRIRGANAAAATVLLVSSVPSPPEIDVTVSASASTPFDPIAPLTDHFYVVLSELHDQVRHWEENAPKGEQMSPERMAGLWSAAVDACVARGDDVTDIFGRRLKLTALPDDLLELAAPRAVVIEGTRLPEDMDNWVQWVRRSES